MRFVEGSKISKSQLAFIRGANLCYAGKKVASGNSRLFYRNMGKITPIQWAHTTVNPTSGCDGCELFVPPPARLTPEELKEWIRRQPCYAGQVHVNRLARSYPEKYAQSFNEVRLVPGRMRDAAQYGVPTDKENADKPWFVGKPRHIFISDMADALSRDVPFEYLKSEIIDVVSPGKGQRHIWQWLTKRPERMAEFDQWLASRGIEWPENLWAGTSVTNQRTLNVRMMPLLLVRAKVRFLSCEPLFTEVRLGLENFRTPPKPIHWVIVGGASGRDPAPFNVAWAYSIIKQCDNAGIPCFVKQMGARPVETIYEGFEKEERRPTEERSIDLSDSHGGDWSEWPDHLRVREIP